MSPSRRQEVSWVTYRGHVPSTGKISTPKVKWSKFVPHTSCVSNRLLHVSSGREPSRSPEFHSIGSRVIVYKESNIVYTTISVTLSGKLRWATIVLSSDSP